MKNTPEKTLAGKKYLFATIAADGHFNPLTGLAKYLLESGCEVRWYTSSIYQERLDKMGIPLYPFLKAPEVNHTNLDDVMPERRTITDAGEKANLDLLNVFIKPGPTNFSDIVDIMKDFPFDALIVDNMFPGTPYASAKLNVPVVAIGIIPLPERSEDLGPYGPGFYPPETLEERIKIKEIKAEFDNSVYKEGTDYISKLLTEHSIDHEKTDVFDILTKAPDVYLQIGSPSFEYQRSDLGKNIRFIGALLPHSGDLPGSERINDRIKKFKRIIIVTQGTVEKDITKLVEPTLEAFKDTDVLVIATTSGNQTDRLREKYPYDNVIIENFIPYSQIMPYASVFITNGGYGGVLFSIMNELAMVTAGLFEGKAEVCARVGHLEYGIDLKTERPSIDQIKKAVHSIFENPAYTNNVISLGQEMRYYDTKEIFLKVLLDAKKKSDTN